MKTAVKRILTVFPAYAGVILFDLAVKSFYTCVPRVCGGDPGSTIDQVRDAVCSPRMRG